MKNIIMYKDGRDSFISWIIKRIILNLNFIALFQGPTGSGKTWASISVALKLDKDFDVRQIVFSFREMMEVINSDWFKQKKIKIIIFDEPQTEISNRNWQSLSNKMMNYLLSTFRHQNIILFFASPYADFLDSQSMKLLHCIFECAGVDRKRGKSRLRPKIQQYNSFKKKTYQHPLQVIHGKKTKPLRDWYVDKPPKDIIDVYEQKKTDFTSALNKEIADKLNELEKKKNEEPKENKIDTRKELTQQQEKVMELLGQGYSITDTAKLLNVLPSAISNTKKACLKKGYKVKEFRND